MRIPEFHSPHTKHRQKSGSHGSTEYSKTGRIQVSKVRQGHIFSYLFKQYTEYIFRKAGLEDERSFKTGRRNINNLHCSEDIALI